MFQNEVDQSVFDHCVHSRTKVLLNLVLTIIGGVLKRCGKLVQGGFPVGPPPDQQGSLIEIVDGVVSNVVHHGFTVNLADIEPTPSAGHRDGFVDMIKRWVHSSYCVDSGSS